ncbi:MAG: nitroreductase [Thermoplasmata archaeon]|nr:nitroreductase [Thermoplasmata archaeon]
MDVNEAIQKRHSVRQYTDKKIEGDVLNSLEKEIDRINLESGLHIRLVRDEPKAFGSMFAKNISKFKGVENYLAIIGPDSDDLEEKAGYYGEQLVLCAQELGLNTCWAVTAGKKDIKKSLEDGYKDVISIAIGYGENQGVPHTSKPMEDFGDIDDAPDWFVRGIESSMLAPTAMNKQNFHFERDGNNVHLVSGKGPFRKIDDGIVKYHFECGAGKDNFNWK